MYKFPKSEHLNYIYQMLYCQWLHVLSIPGSLELENIFQAANNNTQEHLLTQLLLVFFNCYWSLSRVSAAPKLKLNFLEYVTDTTSFLLPNQQFQSTEKQWHT